MASKPIDISLGLEPVFIALFNSGMVGTIGFMAPEVLQCTLVSQV